MKQSIYYYYNNFEKGLQSLSEEMRDFAAHVCGTAAEQAAREAHVARVRAFVCSLWPEADVLVYGSFATGLYLPDSDIDLVVLNSPASLSIHERLRLLVDVMTRERFGVCTAQYENTRVPVVKMLEAVTGCRVDICFDQRHVEDSVAVVRRCLRAFPEMRPLVLVLKHFMLERQLNIVYSGGLSSHALVIMVAHLLKYYPLPADLESVEDGLLAVRLVQFFYLYGIEFNTVRDVVSLQAPPGARHLHSGETKAERGWFVLSRAHDLAVEDPVDRTNNMTVKCNLFSSAIQHEYKRVWRQLNHVCEHARNLGDAPSILSTIIDPAYYYAASASRSREALRLMAQAGSAGAGLASASSASVAPSSTTTAAPSGPGRFAPRK